MLDVKSNIDQELLLSLKSDSQAAFTTIYNLYSDKVYLAARRMLDDEDACFDIVQDIFEWLWCNRHSVEIRALQSYLVSAARFKVLNVIKKERFTEQLKTTLAKGNEDCDALDIAYEVKELQEIIRQFTATLPDQAKKIFHLSRNEHLSHKEIAEQLNLSESTVKKQINITLKKLRFRLGNRAMFVFFFF